MAEQHIVPQNHVVCVYEAICLIYVHNVIDRNANKELLAEYGWGWLKTTVQANKLQVTSDGRWLADQDASEQIALTPQGRVRLISRERASPADRCCTFVFQGVPARQLAILAPAIVDDEEKAFLTEVVGSANKELQDEEEEDRADLQTMYVETLQDLFSGLPPPANMAARTRCII